ncbi:MAG: hypothetical protein ACXVWF_01575, partial [Actinomycetota bacterium]
TRFWFFGTYTGVMALPQQWWFEVAVLVRTLVLVWCLIGWVRRALEPNVLDRRGWEPPTATPVAEGLPA